MKILKQSFFIKDTVQIAVDLLGCFLIRKTKTGKTLIGRIVETEAYLGIKDPCCHSFKGLKTNRTEVMYFSGGYTYIYFTYGMYHCFNVVTAKKNEPEAVLIRALEPIAGFKEMERNRNTTNRMNLTTGPGKLCQALDISKTLNGRQLWRKGEIYIAQKTSNLKVDAAVSHRIGLPLYNEACYWPLRFYIKNNIYVSVKEKLKTV